jgi:hypothetical protein
MSTKLEREHLDRLALALPNMPTRIAPRNEPNGFRPPEHLHPAHSKINPGATFKSRKPLVKCKICGAFVQNNKLPTHALKVHPQTREKEFQPTFQRQNGQAKEERKLEARPTSTQSIKPLVKCEQCAAMVRSDRLERHTHKVHPISKGVTGKKKSVLVSIRPTRPKQQDKEEREERISVRTVSGGGFEINRRRH